MTTTAAIVGAAQSPYTRHPPVEVTTESVLVDAVLRALDDAGLHRDEVDGLAVASFTLRPDHAVDLAWQLGMPLRWIMEDTNGGASGVNMLQHAARAVEAGDASTVVAVAGDHMTRAAFAQLVAEYNRATRDHVTPLPSSGPNPMFAFLTQRHMARYGLERVDYGRLAVAQRRWAGLNPAAVYRTPLTLQDYLDAPPVAPPLHRYDCVPPVTGADAIVITTTDRMPHQPAARVLATGGHINPDNQEGDGLTTGLATAAPGVWDQAGVGPQDIDLACLYDDYPAMVLIQLTELGLVPDGDLRGFLLREIEQRGWPLNTSGGQLSAGQAGAAGGMHGLVEAATQLRGRAGERQVAARLAAVSGYGMVLYRYGACANLTVLEASPS